MSKSVSLDSIINDLHAQIESLELRLDAQDAVINDLYERLDSRITEIENLRKRKPRRLPESKNKGEENEDESEEELYPKHRKWALIDPLN